MLSKAQNDLVTQTGPGTPGGKLLRSYWQPIATDEEMPIGGAPMPITIMGEELVLFRDDKDRLGLIGLHCPHRATDLSYGRVENGGLRCLYHGWLFDINGKCIDQPAEPDDKKFCHKVRHTSYPVQQKGGAIWTYTGEGEPPLIPDYQFLTAPEHCRMAFRVVQDCNWLQGLESSTDPAHTSYLHRMSAGPLGGLPALATQSPLGVRRVLVRVLGHLLPCRDRRQCFLRHHSAPFLTMNPAHQSSKWTSSTNPNAPAGTPPAKPSQNHSFVVIWHPLNWSASVDLPELGPQHTGTKPRHASTN